MHTNRKTSNRSNLNSTVVEQSEFHSMGHRHLFLSTSFDTFTLFLFYFFGVYRSQNLLTETSASGMGSWGGGGANVHSMVHLLQILPCIIC
jgi:hypothetical protein